MWCLRRIGFILLLFIITSAATAAQAGPVAVIETKDYTFPSVVEGTDARHNFVIRNKGDEPLAIQDVKAG